MKKSQSKEMKKSPSGELGMKKASSSELNMKKSTSTSSDLKKAGSAEFNAAVADLLGGFLLPTPDGQMIYVKTWQAKGEKPIAVLYLVHGIGEHINRYEHVSQMFNEKGIKVVGFDQRGHGRTAGTRGDAGVYMNTMKDMETVIANGFERGLPHFLYGHSLGGMHVLNFIARRAPEREATYPIVGVIASAPAVQPAAEPPRLKLAMGSMLKNLPGINTVTVTNELDIATLTRDEETKKKYVEDPLVHLYVSLRSGPEYIAAGNYLLKEGYKTFNKPVYIAHGDNDGLTSQPHSYQFYEMISVKDKTYKLYPGFYHELHNEPEREEVIGEYIKWILDRVPKTEISTPAEIVASESNPHL